MHPASQLYPLDPSGAEAILLPLHDPVLASGLRIELEPGAALRPRMEHGFGATTVTWERSPHGQEALRLVAPCQVWAGRFDRLVFVGTLSSNVALEVHLRAPDGWSPAAAARIVGTGARQEIDVPVTQEAISGVRLTFTQVGDGEVVANLGWVGLAQDALRHAVHANAPEWDPRWPGLIRDDADWSAPTFARGLFFAARDLDALRRKRDRPVWRQTIETIASDAADALLTAPEAQIGEFLPWPDHRFVRTRDQQQVPYVWPSLSVGLIGLLDGDETMMRHAVRALLSMAHTPHWCQTAECRLRGSTWDLRCFVEEMAVTCSAILLDWFGFALTDRAHDLVRTAMWDKGMAYIERDLAKHGYMHGMNQGLWFGRGRVLGALMLETAWPWTEGLADRAARAQIQDLERYLQPDGGADEGLMYFSVAAHAALHSWTAYARVRGRDPRGGIAGALQRSALYLRTFSAAEPGAFLVDGDAVTDRPLGDAFAIMASLFPASAYAEVLEASIDRDRRRFWRSPLINEVLGFVLGPDDVTPRRRTLVPTYAALPDTGALTSLRHLGDGRSVRLHLTGCKPSPSHSHRDKGAFTLELDGRPVLVDRGTVDYEDVRAEVLHRSRFHNLLTPVGDGGHVPDQRAATVPAIPRGRGDATVLEASIDLADVWHGWLSTYERRIVSPSPRTFVVRDSGVLRSPGQVAFHLHALTPFDPRAGGASLAAGVDIDAPWAVAVDHFEDGVDFAHRPVFHLVLIAPPAGDFDLATSFTIDA